MSETIILDTPNITIRYLPDKKMIYHTVHQPFTGEPLREALTTGFDALQQYGVCKWLSDERKNGPMSEEDREWGHANLDARAMEAGWRYWALVVPEQVIAAGAMAPTMNTLFELGLRMMVFSDVDAAFDWLEKVEG